MIRRIALWLLDWLYKSLDTDVAAELDAFKAKATAAKQASDDLGASLAVTRQQNEAKQAELAELRNSATATSALLITATAEFAKARDDLSRLESAKAQIEQDAAVRRAEIVGMTDEQVLHADL